MSVGFYRMQRDNAMARGDVDMAKEMNEKLGLKPDKIKKGGIVIAEPLIDFDKGFNRVRGGGIGDELKGDITNSLQNNIGNVISETVNPFGSFHYSDLGTNVKNAIIDGALNGTRATVDNRANASHAELVKQANAVKTSIDSTVNKAVGEARKVMGKITGGQKGGFIPIVPLATAIGSYAVNKGLQWAVDKGVDYVNKKRQGGHLMDMVGGALADAVFDNIEMYPPEMIGGGLWDSIKDKAKGAWETIKNNPLKTLGALASSAVMGASALNEFKEIQRSKKFDRDFADFQKRQQMRQQQRDAELERQRIGTMGMEERLKEPPKFHRLMDALSKKKKFTREQGFNVGGQLKKAICLCRKYGDKRQLNCACKHQENLMKGGSLKGILNFLSNTFPKWVARWTGADGSLARDVSRGIKRRR